MNQVIQINDHSLRVAMNSAGFLYSLYKKQAKVSHQLHQFKDWSKYMNLAKRAKRQLLILTNALHRRFFNARKTEVQPNWDIKYSAYDVIYAIRDTYQTYRNLVS